MINAALIGTGHRAWGYVKTIQSIRGINITRAYDHNPARLEDFIFKAKSVYGLTLTSCHSISDLFVDGNHVAFICTPDNTHLEILEEAGKYTNRIVLEKPICINTPQLERMKVVKNTLGISIAVPFVLRYMSVFKRLKELIGLVGEITRVSYDHDLSISHSASYHRRWHRHNSTSGGIMVTKGCHDVDIILWLLGSAWSRVIVEESTTVFDSDDVTDRTGSTCSDCVSTKCKLRYDKKNVYVNKTSTQRVPTQRVPDVAHDLCLYENDHDISAMSTALIVYPTAICTYSLSMFREHGNRIVTVRGVDGTITLNERESTISIKIVGKPLQCEIIPVGKGIHRGADRQFMDEVIRTWSDNKDGDILFDEAVQATVVCLRKS